jgi:hypothetical protein
MTFLPGCTSVLSRVAVGSYSVCSCMSVCVVNCLFIVNTGMLRFLLLSACAVPASLPGVTATHRACMH